MFQQTYKMIEFKRGKGLNCNIKGNNEAKNDLSYYAKQKPVGSMKLPTGLWNLSISIGYFNL